MAKRQILRNLEGRGGTEGLTADSYAKILPDWNLGSVCGLRGMQHGRN